MSFKHIIIAVVVALVWGFNFIPMKWALDNFSPLTLGGLRYLFVAFPLIFFLPKPEVPFRYVLAFGLISVFMQFLLLFVSIQIGLSTGIAAVILQTQAMFTILFGFVWLGEKPKLITIIGMIVAFLGLAILAIFPNNINAPLLGLILCFLAAAFWAIGNIIIRIVVSKGYKPKMLNFMVWSSLFLPIPFFLGSWLFEPSFYRPDGHLGRSIFSILFLSYASSIFGYTVWCNLLTKYNASIVTPYSLLVPPFTIIFSYLAFGDVFYFYQWLGVIIVFTGLLMHIFGTYYLKVRATNKDKTNVV